MLLVLVLLVHRCSCPWKLQHPSTQHVHLPGHHVAVRGEPVFPTVTVWKPLQLLGYEPARVPHLHARLGCSRHRTRPLSAAAAAATTAAAECDTGPTHTPAFSAGTGTHHTTDICYCTHTCSSTHPDSPSPTPSAWCPSHCAASRDT